MHPSTWRSYFWLGLPLALAGLLLLATLAFAPSQSARAGFLPALARAPRASTVFINEIHYDNDGVDSGEGIEIAGPAGANLSGWSLVLYNGADGAPYHTLALSGMLPDQQNGYGAQFFPYPSNGIQNGAPDGIALVDAASAVVQFLSYEGAFSAASGPAAGMFSVDIGVSEVGLDPPGASLQLAGSGSSYEDFTWTTPLSSTYDAANQGQTFVAPLASDLTLTQRGSTLIALGDPISYTLTVGNFGIPSADQVLLTDTLPAGATFLAQNSPYTLTNPSLGVYVWHIGTLISGTQAIIALTVTTDLNAASGAIYTNTAQVSTTSTGDERSNNQSTWETSAYPLVSIHDVQFVPSPAASDVSLFNGQMVWVEGLVVAEPGEIDVPAVSFILQEPAGGEWSGLRVVNSPLLQAPEGALLRVLGAVSENFGQTELNLGDDPNAVRVLASGLPLPTPQMLATSDFPRFGPVSSERWEGVLLEFRDATVTDTSLGYGEWLFDDGSGLARADDLGSLDGDLSYLPGLGDRYQFIRGVGWYSFGSYKIEPRYDPDIRLSATHPAISKSAPQRVDPRATFTYTLSVQNDFDDDLMGLVITDRLPTDARFAWVSPGGAFAGDKVTWSAASLPAHTGLQVSFAVTATDQITFVYNTAYAVSASNFTTPTFGAPVFTLVSPEIRIHHLQGRAHRSQFAGQIVEGVAGIVTARRSNGFYMQDVAPDDDLATSEGIFVLLDAAPVAQVGDLVSVSGLVEESYPGGITAGGLSSTEISTENASVTVLSSGGSLPEPLIIGADGRLPPDQVIEDDTTDGSVETSGIFDPQNDGIDFYESLESMLVRVKNAIAVSATGETGEITVVGDQGSQAGLLSPRGGIIIQPGDFNPERIMVDDAMFTAEPQVLPGDSFPGLITGVLDYSANNFKLINTAPLPAVIPGGLLSETAVASDPSQLSVAAFNVENLDPTDPPEKFARLALQITHHLQSPDILSLEEVQDNNGALDDSLVNASLTYQTLIAAIQAAGGPAYDFRDISPWDDQDGGQPGGNIRVGFLFRPDRIDFVDRPGGDATTGTSLLLAPTGVELEYSPGRIDPTNSAFIDSRKPLAGEFIFQGHRLIVIANHFNSKSGDDALFGRFQPPVLASEARRTQQAALVNAFVAQALALDGDLNVVVLGDLNDFQFSTPLQTLQGSQLHNLTDLLPPEERYTYLYEGNSQAIDHILVSDHLFDNPGLLIDIIHVNAEFSSEDQASDHDPVLARFSMEGLIAGFTSNSPINLGELAVFTNTTSAPAPLTFQWDFGDASPSSTQAHPTHWYTLPGVYTVTLTAASPVGVAILSQPFQVLPFALYLPIVPHGSPGDPNIVSSPSKNLQRLTLEIF